MVSLLIKTTVTLYCQGTAYESTHVLTQTVFYLLVYMTAESRTQGLVESTIVYDHVLHVLISSDVSTETNLKKSVILHD